MATNRSLLSASSGLFIESSCPIALVGCQNSEFKNVGCESDLLIVSDKDVSQRAVRMGGDYFDILSVTDKAVREAAPELLLSATEAVFARDPQLVLAGLSQRAAFVGKEVLARRIALRKVGEGLIRYSRVRESIENDDRLSASLWFTAAGYLISQTAILSSGENFRPTHMFSQFRKTPEKAKGKSYNVFAQCVRLDAATVSSVHRRLKTLEVIRHLPAALQKDASRNVFSLTTKKVGHLLQEGKVNECFCYLGFEIVRQIEELYASYCSARGISPLFSTAVREMSKDSPEIETAFSKYAQFEVGEKDLEEGASNLHSFFKTRLAELSKTGADS